MFQTMDSKEEKTGESKLSEGHSSAIAEVKETVYVLGMRQNFENIVEAGKHLYCANWEHLQMIHGEFPTKYGLGKKQLLVSSPVESYSLRKLRL